MAAHGGAEADYNGVSEALGDSWGDVVFVNTGYIHPNRAHPIEPNKLWS